MRTGLSQLSGECTGRSGSCCRCPQARSSQRRICPRRSSGQHQSTSSWRCCRRWARGYRRVRLAPNWCTRRPRSVPRQLRRAPRGQGEGAAYPELPYKEPDIYALSNQAVSSLQQHSTKEMAALHGLAIAASRHRGIAVKHRGIAASRHRGIAASRHRGLAAKQASNGLRWFGCQSCASDG